MSLREFNTKLTFSGHDTFHCRHLWLKKGYDFIAQGKRFTDDDAVITLGVGKNMVSAIHFWLRAFGLLDKDGNSTELANYIFGEEGKDPFLEDNATLWLLHFNLITHNFASIYGLIFNELRKERIEFSKEGYMSFVTRKADEVGLTQLNRNTISADFDVLAKMYIRTNEQLKDKEDTFSGLLTDLNIIKEEKRRISDKLVSFFAIPNETRVDLPSEVLLYGILDINLGSSISINTILYDKYQPGTVFAITKDSLIDKLDFLIDAQEYKNYGMTLSDQAGINELQFKSRPNKFTILDIYYDSAL